MIKNNLISIIILGNIILILLRSCAFNEEPKSNEVTIGNQVWMTRNLDVSNFQNGDPITHAKTDEEWEMAVKNKQPAWCFYNNDASNSKKIGKLYNFYAVNDPRGLAPKGWHVPSDLEWFILIDFLGGKEVAGCKLKSTTGWDENSLNGNNNSGFSLYPGGWRTPNGFQNSDAAFLWSSADKETSDSWYRYFGYSGYVDRFNMYIENGLSVRCIKD